MLRIFFIYISGVVLIACGSKTVPSLDNIDIKGDGIYDWYDSKNGEKDKDIISLEPDIFDAKPDAFDGIVEEKIIPIKCSEETKCPKSKYCDLEKGICVDCLLDSHCKEGEKCYKGICCKPQCSGKECGDNGCGGSCGKCSENKICSNGKCILESSCIGKQCDEKGICGKCVKGLVCKGGYCVPKVEGCAPLSIVGCNGCECEECVCNIEPLCCTAVWSSYCAQLCKECGTECPCIPKCCIGEDCSIWPPPKGSDHYECGPDGCGGSCGKCPQNQICYNHYCTDSFFDFGKECEKNNDCLSGYCIDTNKGKVCTISCIDSCPMNWVCKNGICYPPENCIPKCKEKDCGPDGCGGFCGKCNEGMACSLNGKCDTPSDGCTSKPGIPSCGGCECEKCVCKFDPYCCSTSWDNLCVEYCKECGIKCDSCKPKCEGKECGFNNCGGYCGYCMPWEKCINGKCVCIPQCENRECGPDGCGGSCGECEKNGSWGEEICNSDGKCVSIHSGCETSFNPGCNDCLCEKCVCNSLPYCCSVKWDYFCVLKCEECGILCP